MEIPGSLKIKLFCDGADLANIRAMAAHDWVAGFTTNPTLMRQAGVRDYAAFAKEVLNIVPDRPVSFEVFADDLAEMERQAHIIAGWAPNVNVKIPVTNTKREFTGPIIQRLSAAGIVVNVTAIMTVEQVNRIAEVLSPDTPAIVSVFAGRIADTGIDPVPPMRACVERLAALPKAELLWASPRELLNVFQANDIGCHIITATPDILGKLALVGKDLEDYSLETVKMFDKAAWDSGFTL
jgi:transaldolase